MTVLLSAAVLMIAATAAFAQNAAPSQLQRAAEQTELIREQACADVVAAMTLTDAPPPLNVSVAPLSASIQNCNDVTAKDVCAMAMERVRRTPRPKDYAAGRLQVSYPLPEGFDCHGYSNPNVGQELKFDQPPRPHTETANKACAPLQTSIFNGVGKDGSSSMGPVWIAECSAHPDPDFCRLVARSIWLRQNDKFPPGLTCGCPRGLKWNDDKFGFECQ